MAYIGSPAAPTIATVSDGTVTSAKLADDAVTSAKITDGAVTPTDLSTGHPNWDSSGNFQFNSGYGSVATAYACRAWVNFDGTGTVAIRASGNVSSITDNGTGNYTVNFTTAMPDGNYAMVSCASDEGSGPLTYVQQGTRLTTSCPVKAIDRNGSTYDTANYQCGFFR